MRHARPIRHWTLGLLVSGCAAQETRVVTVTRETVMVGGEAAPGGGRVAQQATVTLFPPTPPGIEPAAMLRALEGHGSWAESLRFGAVWVPEVGAGWIPYASDGRWVSTREGWSWQSDEPWGLVAFHYGRWTLDQGSWAWVPGTRYAPAWVEWRAGSGWTGWAPLAPQGERSRAPFVYCNTARLEGAGLWSRLVQGPAAVSLFAATTALDPTSGSALAAAPEAFEEAADALVGTMRRSRTLGFTSALSARSYATEPSPPSPRVAGYAPVHMPPPADAVSPSIAGRFGYGFAGSARAPVTAHGSTSTVASYVPERGMGNPGSTNLPTFPQGVGVAPSMGSSVARSVPVAVGGAPVGSGAVPAASAVPAATFSQGVSTSPVAAW